MADERTDPLAQHRAVMKQLFLDNGPEAIIGYIQGFDSNPLRRVLYIAAKEVLAPQDFAGKDLEGLILVSESALAELDRQAEQATEAEERAGVLHAAHIVGYNLAAELADCWPGDELPRNEEHHRRGVRAAEECLSISKPASRPKPIANDYWVRGIHELALGEIDAAVESWARAGEFARQAASVEGASTEPGPEGTFLVNLTSGYLGLAQWAAGDKRGRAVFETAVAALKAHQKNPEQVEDANLGIGQLEKAKHQYVPRDTRQQLR